MKMSEDCSSRIRDNFTEEIMCNKYLDLYKKINNE